MQVNPLRADALPKQVTVLGILFWDISERINQ